MKLRSTLALSVLVGSLILSAGGALAQPEGGDRGDRRERFENMTEEQRAQFRERMEQRMAERQREQAERMQEELGVSSEEFALLQPRIEKIRTLQRERQFAGRGFGGERRGGFAGEMELSAQGQALRDASTKLRETLDDEAASADAIKAALTSVREARIALDSQIATAQEDLRGLLTARQEASLVVSGVLE